MSAIERLINHWRAYEPSGETFAHKADAAFAAGEWDAVHTNVSAFPYVGDLKQADVWLLMLNSKLGISDEIEEGTEPYRSLFRANLLQDFQNVEFPLLSLDPSLAGTGTYKYYNFKRGLARLIDAYAHRQGIGELEARRVCARRIAILELLPYRSSEFPKGLSRIPSVNLARAAAREASIAKTLIVPWSIDSWSLRRSPSVLNRPSRTFSFAPGGVSGYGEAILDTLCREVVPEPTATAAILP